MKIWEKMQKSSIGQSIEAKSIEHQLKEEKNKNQKLNFQLAEKESRLSRAALELSQVKSEKHDLSAQNNALHQACKKLQDEVNTLKNSLSHSAGEIDRLVREFKDSEIEHKKKLKHIIHQFNSEKTSLENKLSGLQQENLQSTEAKKHAEKELQEFKEKSNSLINSKEESIQRITGHFHAQVSSLRKDQDYYKNLIDELKRETETNSNLLRSQKLSYKKQILDLEVKLQKNQKIIDEATKRYKQEKNTLEFHKNQQIQSLRLRQSKLEQEISSQKTLNTKSFSEIEKLQRLLEKNKQETDKIQKQFEEDFKERELKFKKLIYGADCKIKDLSAKKGKVSQKEENTYIKLSPEEKIEQKKDRIKTKVLNRMVAQHTVKTPTKSNDASFDGLTYLSLNPELARESKIKIEDAKQHYKYFGSKEGKQCKQNKLWLQTYCYSNFERKNQNFYLIKSKKEAPSIYLGAESLCNLYFKKLYRDFEFVGYWDRRITSLINVDLDLKNLLKKIDRHEDQFQILSLNTTSFRDKLFSEPHQGSSENPDVWLALIKIISKMQSLEIINSSIPNLDAKTLRIYCNAFLVKKEIFEDYVSNFLIPALNIIKTDPEISEICAANSLCMGSVDSKNLFPFHDFLKQSNINYYPISSVVLDRLINCYALIKNYKIGFIL